MSAGQPPRYVPTLTEVVGRPPAEPVSVTLPVNAPEPEPLPEPLFDGVAAMAPVDDEERLLRVLQRAEVMLDRRLTAAVAHVAETVSREFAQRLRAEMEPLIREVVSEALAAELAPANPPPS